MPIYTYRCQKCGNQIEILTNNVDLIDITEFCNLCKERTLHLKKISLSNFKFKNGQMNKDSEK